MLRDLKSLRRNGGGKNEETENLPLNSNALSSGLIHGGLDSSRAPFGAIQEMGPNPKPERMDKTPTKPKGRYGDTMLPLQTPDGHNFGVSARHRFGWVKSEATFPASETVSDDSLAEGANSYYGQGGRGIGGGIGGLATPRTTRTLARANSNYSESYSVQSTPNKSVSKPPSVTCRSKVDGNGGGRWGNFAALYKGLPSSGNPPPLVNTVEVPHFDLKEDPSFWMEHNVQVVVRVRPLNSREKNAHGYYRCLKQESSQSITWIGQPEARFTFDHIACESVDQEVLFRRVGLPMVENCLSGYNSCMFAYGQTGSGKTYTMLGEMEDMELQPGQHQGMTPRIFEFLFARIQAEEESRRDEKLKYNCKCSFLEIYNEQITDLLDPSSTNLSLREDVKQGVYVENLSEFEVQSVGDILRLLIQGSLSRKVAATSMNRESSRSHSVFTCVIECRWEKDSSANLRFARLNLVDLAGSERQKTSGAEGDRLKEAASINKSLSSLGHVIMVLVDVANGKPRHVPYRDSRLTFLLQDSLGGNSKTIIIANVSPSVGSSAETLNTLKFAQRAKLIQNNAVVNEDATGDVIALQNQIRLLKEELAALRRQNVSRSLGYNSSALAKAAVEIEQCTGVSYSSQGGEQGADDLPGFEFNSVIRLSNKQLKSLESTLAGAMRREQMADTTIKQLEAEIEQLNRLVRQREEECRCTKMMLKFREEKIQRMDSVLGGSISSETYLHEENKHLSEEIQLLQARVDKNPEVTRFALENIRLLDQLRRFQEFYEEGEREILLQEVARLRDELLQFMDGCQILYNHPTQDVQLKDDSHASKENASLHLELKNTSKELEECRLNLNSCLEENARLDRELHHLRSKLDRQGFEDTIKDGKIDLELELDIFRIMVEEERTSRFELEKRLMSLNDDLKVTSEKFLSTTTLYNDATQELSEAKSIIDALESQQVLSISEVDDLQRSNNLYKNQLLEKETEIAALKKKLSRKAFADVEAVDLVEGKELPMQLRVKRMQDSLDKARQLTMRNQNGHKLLSDEEEREKVCKQAEAETAEVIVCMQEELALLQKQVEDSQHKEMESKNSREVLEAEVEDLQRNLDLVTKKNKDLAGLLEERGEELKTLSAQCKILSHDIEELLTNSNEALEIASDELDHMLTSFPQKRIWITDQFSQIIRAISEKELLIEELRGYLEDALCRRTDLECMLKSLRGAALAITEAHRQEISYKDRELCSLRYELDRRVCQISKLEDMVEILEHNLQNASNCATAAFVVVNRVSEVNMECLGELKKKDLLLNDLSDANMRNDILLHGQAATIDDYEKQINGLGKDLVDAVGTCTKLRQRISEEQRKAQEKEQNDIIESRSKLDELKNGIATAKSCMDAYLSENCRSPKQIEEGSCASSPGITKSEEGFFCQDMQLPPIAEGLKSDDLDNPSPVGKTASQKLYSLPMLDSATIGKELSDKDITIALLRREIEFALESLKHVQADIAMMQEQKRERVKCEKLEKEKIHLLLSQLHTMDAAMRIFEEKSSQKIEVLESKLHSLRPNLEDACSTLSKTKELLELEVGEAAVVAEQKSEEAVYVLAKFEEAQETLKEADTMINKLVTANGTLKHDIEMLEDMHMSIVKERDGLLNEVRDLQSLRSSECEQYEILLKDQMEMQLAETKDLFTEMETMLSQFQGHFKLQFSSLASDFDHVKFEVLNSTKKVKSWFEEIWSEIISRDCAVSCLHLCHMGILLETLTGLNTEKSLLEHGLQETNTVLYGLRENNHKSMKELEVCRNLRGKLLADIKSSFDRISLKEEETEEMQNKLKNFELNILDLQHQEESMLERSHYMASQLAALAKELDLSNVNVVTSLMDHEELLISKFDEVILEFCWKDIELSAATNEMKELAAELADLHRKNARDLTTLGDMIEEIYLSRIDQDLTKEILFDYESDIFLLNNKLEDSNRGKQEIMAELRQKNVRILEMNDVVRNLEQDNKMLKELGDSNALLKAALSESEVSSERLLNLINTLEAERREMCESLLMKETALNNSSGQLVVLNEHNDKLLADIHLMEASLKKLQSELDCKDKELTEMASLREENCSLKTEIMQLETQNILVVQDLAEKKSECQSSSSSAEALNKKLLASVDQIALLKGQIDSLKTDIMVKEAELDDMKQARSALMEEMKLKNHKLEVFTGILQEENATLRTKLESCEKGRQGVMHKCVKLVDNMEMFCERLLGAVESEKFANLGNAMAPILEDMQHISSFINFIECLDDDIKNLTSENSKLQSELLRKDDLLEGLLFDLSLLQESASNNKDQKEEITAMAATLQILEEKLLVKSGELAEVVKTNRELESELQENVGRISTLETEMSKQHERISLLSTENLDLEACFKRALAEKSFFAEDLFEKRKTVESLELELSEMVNLVDQMNKRVESLECQLKELTIEKDSFHGDVLALKEDLINEQTLAHDNEAVALEAQRRAEDSEKYALDKEEEVKLLERSVEELDRTINALENKVEIIMGEAERKCLANQDLELELHALKDQIQNLKDADADMNRILNEKSADLEIMQKQNLTLKTDVVNRDLEIEQLKAHISELNLIAEAQASECLQKFKELEALAEQVRPELSFAPSAGQLTFKSEKNCSKSRGSGSPFKCIGSGLVHQIKSEKYEELTSARKRIEELELVVETKQKDILALKAKLATSDSMTHDVIRDLLRVKLDMNSYASMLDDHHAEKMEENPQVQSLEMESQDLIKLKKQLNEYMEERQRWLEEIDRKQAELIALQITLEKHRQQEQLLKAENEVLKMENTTIKKTVVELEKEISRLAGQQNLQQRIHHHAKIKEENNNLKAQNENLASKLRRSEAILSSIKEELAWYRASVGENLDPHPDENVEIWNKLKETEEERVELARKLLSLCTKVLKVAGFSKSLPEVCPSVAAEEALEQLKIRMELLEGELQDLKVKNRTTSRRSSHAPSFLSSLDR
ncbi:hypothetical protein MLD38_013807 [Melastoma candidum]|uniref:Uncharacterized protein n=1 Tax=Melastoma candidum TaxID=119954 RepID=A0ACB9RAR1_9MYRT|nr:hypothetical protein MLD38_013807 [Melastoma candidum]